MSCALSSTYRQLLIGRVVGDLNPDGRLARLLGTEQVMKIAAAVRGQFSIVEEPYEPGPAAGLAISVPASPATSSPALRRPSINCSTSSESQDFPSSSRAV